MTGHSQHIDAKHIDPRRNLADRMRGVGVKDYAVFSRNPCALFVKLNSANLFVGVHSQLA